MSHLLQDMSPDDLPRSQAYTEYQMNYFDGQSRRVLVVDEEVPYPDGRMIVSRTDITGVITHANKAFVDISGYSREELIGAPQSNLRHPDVPAVIFKDLWDTVLQGKCWYGYVKNLRKDGRYYWVYASVNPNYRDGKLTAITSVRRKPSRDKIAETVAAIARIRAGEAA